MTEGIGFQDKLIVYWRTGIKALRGLFRGLFRGGGGRFLSGFFDGRGRSGGLFGRVIFLSRGHGGVPRANTERSDEQNRNAFCSSKFG